MLLQNFFVPEMQNYTLPQVLPFEKRFGALYYLKKPVIP